ncbi:MAG: bile acid:sodium symporter family protein [Alistipes sp.]|nr:bile acid:sodium symporter family protein [Alistipes sp.]
MKKFLEILDPLDPNLGAGEMTLVNIILALVMFGVALGIKLDTFKDVFRFPKSIIVGCMMQWVALPLVTLLVALAFNSVITPMVALGMILVASCPGGNISNFMSSYAQGNIALSVSMTAVTTAFSPLITPLNFWLYGTLYCNIVSLNNEIPTLVIPFGDMFEQIMLLLGLPIVAGMLFAHYFPKVTQKLLKPSQILSIILFMGMVGVSFTKVVTSLGDNTGAGLDGMTIFIAILCAFVVVIAHNVTALCTGYGGGTLFRLPRIDRRSMTIEVGIQNSGLGLILLFNDKIFDPTIWDNNGGMIFITAIWGVWHIVSGLITASIFRRTKLV